MATASWRLVWIATKCSNGRRRPKPLRSTRHLKVTPRTVPCAHTIESRGGSNGINWRNSCLDCGKVTRGRWDDKHFPATGTTAPSRQFLLGAIGQPVQSDKHFDIHAAQEIIRSALIVANVKSKENNDQLSLEELHKIIDAVAVNVSLLGSDPSSSTTSAAPAPSVEPRTPPRTPPRASPQQPENEELYFWGRRTINFGSTRANLSGMVGKILAMLIGV